jgi:hypothetical protein
VLRSYQVISTVLSVLLIGLSAWHFPTRPGDPEDFLCRSAAARTSIVNMLNGGNTLYVMAVKTQGGDGPGRRLGAAENPAYAIHAR